MVMALNVGERVLVSARDREGNQQWEKATVRYVGPVEEQKGVWVGIEWDDVLRGKHDGQTGGRQYFSCQKTWCSTPASFVREKRIKRGVTLVDAVRDKYCSGVSGELECDMFIHTSSNRMLPVQLVGQDSIIQQQSVLDELKAVYLNGSEFSTMGPAGDVGKTIPRVSELDLSSTLVSSWQEVVKLSDELPKLRLLDISRNEIVWTSLEIPKTPIFQNLRSLILNNCFFADWKTAMSVTSKIQGLAELHMAGNSIRDLQCEDIIASVGKVEVLHLEDNLIQDWSEVKKLSKLPRLRKLNLSGNLLTGIERYSENNKPHFASLTTLFLQNNSLNSWADISALDHFESLTEIRVSGIPLIEKLDMITARMNVAARLPRIKQLNGSSVTQKERADAEIGYLSSILSEAAGKEIKELESQHPRFSALLKSYGNINLNALPSNAATTDRTTISKTLLSLELSSIESLETMQVIKSVKKKLPSNLTLSKLKVLCQRLLGIPTGNQAVYIKREEPEELIHNEDTLQQLGVAEGQSLLIAKLD